MPSLSRGQDQNARDSLFALLIEAPSLTRRLYPRGGFEGLEANALQVLIAIELQPGASVGELVELLALGQGTVSTALARLQERGLVTARADSRDGRRQRQRVTRTGTQLCRRFARSAEDHMRGR